MQRVMWMFFLNHKYFVDQRAFLPFEEIARRHGLDYFSLPVRIIIFFSHRWLDGRVADNGECFAECKNQVDQIIAGFEDQKEDLQYFGFFFDYSCIPQCSEHALFPTDSGVMERLKRLLLVELYQTVTMSTTVYLCHANSAGYHQRLWIVMELLIALDRGVEQIPTEFRDGPQRLLGLKHAILGISDDTDLYRRVHRITDGLETTLAEDRTTIELTLYRYLKTLHAGIPIEVMNLAIWDVQNGLKQALQGHTARLERHVNNGLSNWRAAIEEMGFDQEFRQRLRQNGLDG